MSSDVYQLLQRHPHPSSSSPPPISPMQHIVCPSSTTSPIHHRHHTRRTITRIWEPQIEFITTQPLANISPSSICSSSAAPATSFTSTWRPFSFSLGQLLLLLTTIYLISTVGVVGRTPPNSLLAPDCPPSLSNHTVRIGVFYCPSPLVTVCSIPHIDLIMDIWFRHVNYDQCGLLGVGTAVEFVPRNLSGSAASAIEIYNQTLSMTSQGEGVDFVILPPGSLWSQAMQLLESLKIPAVAPLTPNSAMYQLKLNTQSVRRYQYAHSISSPAEKYLQGWIGLLSLKQARTLTLVSTQLSTYTTIVNGIRSAASDNHLTIVGTYLGLPTLPGSNGVSQDIINTTIAGVQSLNADAVVILASDCRPWIQALQMVNYLPKSLATLLCTDSPAALQTLGPSLNYIVGPAQWDSHLTGSEYTETNSSTPWAMFLDDSTDAERLEQYQNRLNGEEDPDDGVTMNTTTVGPTSLSSPLQFVQRYQQALNYSSSVLPGYDSASILAALAMLHGGIETAASTDRAAVNQALQLYFGPSFFGLLTTDRYGMNQQKQMPLLQRDQTGATQVIYPSFAATGDFIYPMPSFDERIYTQTMFGLPVERAFIGFILGCVIFTLLLCGYLFHHRANQIFQAAGVQFYMLMGFGCITAYLAILSWTVENNDVSCGIRIWVWTFAFHAFVAPMVSCAFRIARIYTQGLHSVRVSNQRVAGYCALLYTPQLLINILWVSISPLKSTIVVIDPLRPKYDYTICSNDSVGTVIFGSITLVYSGLMLISACYLAWRVRKAYSIFNDAKPIALSMYIFTMTSIIVLVVQLSLNVPDLSSQKVLFALRSAGVLIAYQSSLAILFLRRIFDQLDMGGVGNHTAVGTAVGVDLQDHATHMKSEISEVVWRNDQKINVEAMFRQDMAGSTPEQRQLMEEALLQRAQWMEVVESPAGLFSRGDSSAPPTPMFKPFGANKQQPMGTTPTLPPITTTTTNSPFDHNRLHINSTVHNSPFTGQRGMSTAPASSAMPSIMINSGIGTTPLGTTPMGTTPLENNSPVNRPRQFVPGQALTHSVLGLDDDNNKSPPNGQQPFSRMHMTSTAFDLHEMNLKNESTFPLPTTAQLMALAPTHFFIWKEQVRQHIALLLLQQATKFPSATILPLNAPSPAVASNLQQRTSSTASVGAESEMMSQEQSVLGPRSPSLAVTEDASPSTTAIQTPTNHPTIDVTPSGGGGGGHTSQPSWSQSSPSALVGLLRHAAVVSPVPECHDEVSTNVGHASTNGMMIHMRGESMISRFSSPGDDDTSGTLSPDPAFIEQDGVERTRTEGNALGKHPMSVKLHERHISIDHRQRTATSASPHGLRTVRRHPSDMNSVDFGTNPAQGSLGLARGSFSGAVTPAGSSVLSSSSTSSAVSPISGHRDLFIQKPLALPEGGTLTPSQLQQLHGVTSLSNIHAPESSGEGQTRVNSPEWTTPLSGESSDSPESLNGHTQIGPSQALQPSGPILLRPRQTSVRKHTRHGSTGRVDGGVTDGSGHGTPIILHGSEDTSSSASQLVSSAVSTPMMMISPTLSPQMTISAPISTISTTADQTMQLT